MMKCPACSHENVDGTTFCEMCGEDLNSATGAAPAAATTGGGSTPSAGSGAEIKCPACENMNPAENVVCEICGTDLHAADDDGDATQPAVVTPNTASVPAPPATTDSASTPVSTPAPTAVDTQSTPVAPSAPVPDLADIATPTTDTASVPAVPVSADPAAVAPAGSTPSAAPDAPSAPLVPGKVKLVVEQGMTIGKQFVLSDAEVQVGREDEDEGIYPDIDLADQDEGYVHRKHATLKFENDQLMVTHLGGANKTRINNKPIPDNTPQAAKLGDKIAFGKVVLRLTAV